MANCFDNDSDSLGKRVANGLLDKADILLLKCSNSLISNHLLKGKLRRTKSAVSKELKGSIPDRSILTKVPPRIDSLDSESMI